MKVLGSNNINSKYSSLLSLSTIQLLMNCCKSTRQSLNRGCAAYRRLASM